MNLRHVFSNCFLFFLVGLSFQCLAANSAAESLQNLETDYQRLLASSYGEITSGSSTFKISDNNIKTLIDAIKHADQSGERVKSIALIVANRGFITEHSDANQLQKITQILLKHRAINLVQPIMDTAIAEGNTYLQGRIKFELAKHYAEHNNWQLALAQLNAIDIANTLEKQDGEEAFIIFGAVLQQQKKHREAVKYYARIPSNSTHYRVAQLNTAIAHIRQDWWTDAHIAINKALKHKSVANDELDNRLYTVLGYSQIQHGFYRDARETFRHVHLNSQYANRALFGIGMAALHQEDFIGALNAFNHLKKGDTKDISVLESYLLAAFSLEKLGQQRTASAGYTEAITFYEQQSVLYENSLAQLAQWRESGTTVPPVFAAGTDVELNRIQPQLKVLTTKISHLTELQNYHLGSASQQAIKNLSDRLNQTYIDLATEGLTTKRTIIESYLSQSRFGLAKLYDTK